MPACPHCGAQTRADYGFCVACGATLGAPAAAGIGGALGAAPAPTRPLGKTVAPWKVVVLVFVTLGVYPYVLWWRTSREVDAYAGTRSHPFVRAAVALAILAALGLAVAVFQALSPLMAQAIENPDAPIDQESARAAYLANPIYLGAALLALVASLVLYGGMWRAWVAIRDDEQRRGVRPPLQPALLAGILGGSAILQAVGVFVPLVGSFSFVGFVLTVWILAVWQSRLNETWRAALAPFAPGAW